MGNQADSDTSALLAIPQAVASRAGDANARLVFHLETGTIRLDAGECVERAQGLLGILADEGIGAGDAVGLLGPNRPEWVFWALALWTSGAVVVPLPYPLLQDRRALAEQVRVLAGAAGCKRVLAEDDYLDVVPPGLGLSWQLDRRPRRRRKPRPAQVAPDDIAVIQFTSGTTAGPKGALLTHRAVLRAIDVVTRSGGLVAGRDHLLSWLPFFHDLGMFGYLLRPLVAGLSCDILPTERFARDPASWLRLAGETGATLTAGPSSAWAAALTSAERRADGIDLSTLRGCCLSAETIDPEVADRLRVVGGHLGLRPQAVIGAYGLAEATLGVTGMPLDGDLDFDEVDLQHLAEQGQAVPAHDSGRPVKRVASCGRPMPDMDVRIIGLNGPVPERHVGEITVRGPTLMSGYAGAAAGPVVDGWLYTGDLGYFADGELHVTGRSKDVIISFGRNYAPEDLEWAAARVPGVRPGRCVAFGRPGGREGEAVVVVEPVDPGLGTELVPAIRRAVTLATGLHPEVVVAPRGTVPKTTSGKLRRSSLRDNYDRGLLKPLHSG